MDRFLPIPYVKRATVAQAWPDALRVIVGTGKLAGVVVDQRGDRTYAAEGLQVVITDPLRGMIPDIPRIPGVTAWHSKIKLEYYYETEILGSRPKPEGFAYVYADWIKPYIEAAWLHLSGTPESRRVIISVGNDFEAGYSNAPCLRSVQFLIRDDTLDMITTWRSRDFAGAAATNMYGLIRLQEYVASKLRIPVGTYTDFSGSAHIRIKDDLWWVEKVIA